MPMDYWPIILLCTAIAFVPVYAFAGNYLRRAQVVRALRKERSLRPDHPIRVRDASPFLGLGSARAALSAAIHCRYYDVECRSSDGSMESFALRAVFLPFVPWLRRIDRDVFSSEGRE